MTFRYVYILMVGLVAFGCTTSSDPVSIRGQANILDQIEQDPLKAKELCSQLKESTQREFCIEFALQALPKDELQVTKSLCDTLEGVSKGECWFQVAERSLLMSDCERAIPFVAECGLHLTLSALLRSELQRLKEWDMDPKSSCDVLPHKIAHGDQSALKEPFEAVVKKKCGAL